MLSQAMPFSQTRTTRFLLPRKRNIQIVLPIREGNPYNCIKLILRDASKS